MERQDGIPRWVAGALLAERPTRRLYREMLHGVWNGGNRGFWGVFFWGLGNIGTVLGQPGNASIDGVGGVLRELIDIRQRLS